MKKRPLLYTLVSLLAFTLAGGGTFGYFTISDAINQPSQPSTEPDDGDDVLSEEPQTAKDRFMTNLLAGDLQVNRLDVGIDTGSDNIGVSFTGALSYDGKKLAGGDLTAISASGDLNLKVAGFDETINFAFPGDSTLYFTYMEKDFSVKIDTFTTVLDLIPLFTSSEVSGDQLDESTIYQVKKAGGLDLDLGSLLDDLTDMLNNIQETETATGYDFTLEIPDLLTIILSSDKNEKLTGIRLLEPLEIEGMKITLDASVTVLESSIVQTPTGEYQSLDTLTNVVSTLSKIVESKTLSVKLNIQAKSIEDNSLDLYLNARLAADLNGVEANFDKGIYELSILPQGTLQGNPQTNSIDIHYENETIFLKVNELLKGKITNQSIQDIIAIATQYSGESESTEESEDMLNTLFADSILLELIDGNFDNIKSAIYDLNSYPDRLEVVFSNRFLGSKNNWSVAISYENDEVKAISINGFTIMDFAIDLTIELEKSFSSAEIFEDLSVFKDYRTGVSIYRTIAELMDSMQILTDFSISVRTKKDLFKLNGEIGADLANVDFNNIESLLNGTFKIAAEAQYSEKSKAVSAILQNETLFLNYNDVITNSVKGSSIVDLIDTISNKFGDISSGGDEDIDINEILTLFSLNIEEYSNLIEQIKKFDFTGLDDYVLIDHLNNDPSKITVKILPQKSTRTYIYIELSTDEERITQIKIEDLKIGEASFALTLNLRNYEDITIKDTSNYKPLDSLLGNLTKLVNTNEFNVGINASIVDDDTTVEPITLGGNVQFNIETTEFYGNLDLSAKLPTDNAIYNHHIVFDNYFIGNDFENELIIKYYGNDNYQNPMRLFISDGEFGRMLDVVMNIPDDNSLKFLFEVSTGLTLEMPLMDIINGEYSLLFNDYIKKFDVGATLVDIVIDGAILGFNTLINVQIDYNEEGIQALKIINLKFGSKTINASITLNKVDDSLQSTRLHITDPKTSYTYIDANYLDLFLQIGINTTQSRKFHLYGTFNLTFDTSGLIGGIAGLLLGDVQIYSSVDMKLVISDVDGSVNAVIAINKEKAGGTYTEKENGYRRTEFYILSNNDCIVKQDRVEGGYKQYDVFKVTQSEMVSNIHYYLLKYTFNMTDLIFDIVDDAVLNPPDESGNQENVLNFKYENIIETMKYTEDDRQFLLTIDLNNIIDLSRVTSLISQDKISISFKHTSSYVLESLLIEGYPVSISILGSSIKVGLYLHVFNDSTNSFNMNYFDSFVKSYYDNPIWSNLGYYEYRLGNTGAIYTSEKVRV